MDSHKLWDVALVQDLLSFRRLLFCNYLEIAWYFFLLVCHKVEPCISDELAAREVHLELRVQLKQVLAKGAYEAPFIITGDLGKVVTQEAGLEICKVKARVVVRIKLVWQVKDHLVAVLGSQEASGQSATNLMHLLVNCDHAVKSGTRLLCGDQVSQNVLLGVDKHTLQ